MEERCGLIELSEQLDFKIAVELLLESGTRTILYIGASMKYIGTGVKYAITFNNSSGIEQNCPSVCCFLISACVNILVLVEKARL